MVPALSLVTLAGAIGTEIWRFPHTETIVAGALRMDDLGFVIDLVCAVSAAAAVILAWRAEAPREAGQGEFHSLLLFSVMGMAVLASAQDIITLFLGIELLSIPLYILCAAEYRREGSLESGLKYLIIGSVGSATLVYGLAMIYGATGQTGFNGIARALSGAQSSNLIGDPLLLSGIALVVVGFAFKASVAPFHQWTPDVYEGAPTPITSFMATATKAAALAVFLRFFDVAVISEQTTWAPLLAALATATILIGNVGALGQTSLKRLLGYSGVAQAGYMLSGVVVATQLGISATVLYLIAYLLMNVAAFAVVQSQEAATGDDQISGLAGLGRRSPLLGWGITLAMLGLAGVPGTDRLHRQVPADPRAGRRRLLVARDRPGRGRDDLARVLPAGRGGGLDVARHGRDRADCDRAGHTGHARARPATGSGPAAGPGGLAPVAGGSPEADKLPYPEVVALAALFGALTVFFGVIPGPLFDLASHAGAAITGIF